MRASLPPSRQRSTAAACSCDPRRERGRNRVVIAERQGAVADNLSGLVALAGDQERIARLQGLGQRVGLVGVIDEDRRTVALADPLQPAFCALEMFEGL